MSANDAVASCYQQSAVHYSILVPFPLPLNAFWWLNIIRVILCNVFPVTFRGKTLKDIGRALLPRAHTHALDARRELHAYLSTYIYV